MESWWYDVLDGAFLLFFPLPLSSFSCSFFLFCLGSLFSSMSVFSHKWYEHGSICLFHFVLYFDQAAHTVSTSRCAGILLRIECFVSGCIRILFSLPPCIPPTVRKRVANVYSHVDAYGGCATSGSLWHVFVTVLLFVQSRATNAIGVGLAFSAKMWIVLLVTVGIMSRPDTRCRVHDSFESSH